MKRSVIAIWLSVAAVPVGGAAQTVADLRLSGAAQVELARKAIEICAANGAQVSVAIAGPDRVVRTVMSHDRATPVAIETARRKAVSAALIGYPTAGLTKAVREAPSYVEMLRSLEPALVTIGGGVPIMASGVMIGAIGVGGASGPEADEVCATQAIAAVIGDRRG